MLTITIYRDAAGEWRWSLKARNGRIVGASTESYRGRGGALRNLERVTGFEVNDRGSRGGSLWPTGTRRKWLEVEVAKVVVRS